MNPRRRAFVDSYTNPTSPGFGNASEAARIAGYSPRTANRQGHRLLTKDVIRAEVERRQERAGEKAEFEREQFIREALKQANAWLGADGRRMMRVLREHDDGTLVVEQIRPDASNVKALELAGEAAGFVGRTAEANAAASAQANAGVQVIIVGELGLTRRPGEEDREIVGGPSGESRQ